MPQPKKEAGNALIEFALVATFALPLLLGTVVVGVTIIRGVQTSQVGRDAGHMYAMNVDFSQSANQDVIVRLAQPRTMTRTGGDGVVILSKIIKVYQVDCAAAGLSSGSCTNLNETVFTHRVVIGNSSLRRSAFQPAGSTLSVDAQCNVLNPLTDTNARATNFSSLLAQNAGDIAYVSEAYFSSPDLGFQSYLPVTGNYARSIF